MSSPVSPSCRAHPEQRVSHFCSRSSCYVELCAACICDHTESHNRLNTKPKYQLIANKYAHANELINGLDQEISKEKARVANIIDGIEKQKSQIRCFLKQAREEVVDVVHKVFDELETRFTAQLEQQRQQSGLLHEPRLNQLYAQLNKRTLQVYNMGQELNSHPEPGLVRTLNFEFVPLQKQHIQEIARELGTNQLFQPNLTYRPCYLEEVETVIKKLISTSITYPLPKNGTSDYYQALTRTTSSFGRPVVLENRLQGGLGGRSVSGMKDSMMARVAFKPVSPRTGHEFAKTAAFKSKENAWLDKADEKGAFHQSLS